MSSVDRCTLIMAVTSRRWRSPRTKGCQPRREPVAVQDSQPLEVYPGVVKGGVARSDPFECDLPYVFRHGDGELDPPGWRHGAADIELAASDFGRGISRPHPAGVTGGSDGGRSPSAFRGPL